MNNNQEQKIQMLKWLQDAGVEYYCSTDLELKDKNINSETIKAPTLPQRTEDRITPIVKIATEKSNKLNDELSRPANHKVSDKIIKAQELANSATSLVDLKNKLLSFDGCELKKFATNTVFAEGVTNAQIMLIGEAPGEREDKEGRPFCGESGILLDAMLSAIGLSRSTNAYITNTVFWRPPANRCPTPEEVEICRPFLEKHIALLAPKLIIMVGSTATTTLLGKDAGVSAIREKYYSYTNPHLKTPISATAIFHPAYLLRQPGKKKDSWFDLLKIKQFIDQNL